MIAFLTISTWAGRVPGAEHYYGRIRIGDETTDVQRELTEADAKRMTAEGRRQGDDYVWEAGATSIRYWDEEALRARAAEILAADYPHVTVLFEAESSDLGPKRVLIGPEEFKVEANKIYAEYEADEDDENWRDIQDRWESLCERHLGSKRPR